MTLKTYEKELIKKAKGDQDLLAYWLQREMIKGNEHSKAAQLLKNLGERQYTSQTFDTLARLILERNEVKNENK